MQLFSKIGKSKTVEVSACVQGDLIPIEEVEDEVFASKTLGDGVGIDPFRNTILAPADGQVMHISDTKHAVAIELIDKSELLIHIGIDTVELNGEGFSAFIKAGDKVKKGDKLIQFDKEFIRSKGYNSVVILTIINENKHIIFDKNKKEVNTDHIVAQIK